MRFTVLGRIAVQIMKSYFHDRDWNGDMFKLGDVNEFHMREFYVILLSASIFSGIGLFANPTGKVESLFTACGAVLSFIIAHCTKAATKIERLLFFMLAVLLGWATATPWLSQSLDVDMGFVAAIILAHCVGFLAFYTSSSTMYYHFQFLYIEALANCTYTIFITLSVTTAFFGGNSDHLQAFRYLMWCMVYVVAYSQEVVVRSRREVGDYLMDAIWLYPSLPAFVVQLMKELWRILSWLVVILYKALEKMSFTVLGRIAVQQLKSYFRDRNWNCKMFSVYAESHLKVVYFTMFCVSMSSVVGSLSYPTGNCGCLFTACGAVLSFIIFYSTVQWRKNKRFLLLMLSSLLGWATATPWLSWLLDVNTGRHNLGSLCWVCCILHFIFDYVLPFQFVYIEALANCTYMIFITLFVTTAFIGGNSDHLQAFHYLMWCMVYVVAYSQEMVVKSRRGVGDSLMDAIWLYPSLPLPAFVVQELWRILRRLVIILYKALEKMSLTVFGQIAFQLKSYFRDRNWNCKMFSIYTESHLKEVYFTMFCVSMSSAVGSLSYPTGNFGCLFTACGAVLSFIIFYRTVPWRKNKRFLFLMLSSLLGWATATPWLSWLLDVDTGFVAALILAHCIGFASFYISTHSRWYYYQFIPLDALVRCSYRIFITLYVTRATFGGKSDHLQAFRYLMWCMVYVAAYSLDVAIKLNRGDFNYMMHAIWLYPSLPAFVVQLIRELWRILRKLVEIEYMLLLLVLLSIMFSK